MKIFWSWQDDSPAKTNRQFIKGALEEVVAAIEGDYEAEDAGRPELDHDTKGVAGAREIVPTLMSKIATSVAFVADVTPVGTTAKGKALPNPNVLVELGWSLNKPGDGSQIYVLNTAGGWTVEDLPFDIRHRRVLTYSLSEDADGPARDKVKRALVKDFTRAITAILDDHLEETVQATRIIGVEAKADEPSLWAGGEAGFKHQDSMTATHWRDVSIPARGRAYLRVIPSGWKTKPLTASQVAKLHTDNAPGAPSSSSGVGDFGVTKEGYVRYWIESERDAPTAAENVAMYFDGKGEFWILHGSAVTDAGSCRRSLNLAAVFNGWSTAMRRAHWILDAYGAMPARHVELGFTGIEDARFPGKWDSQSPPARRDELQFGETRRDWGNSAVQEDFLTRALEETLGLFGIEWPANAALQFVRQNDPESHRHSPYSNSPSK